MRAEVSILEPLHNKRARSQPRSRTRTIPDIWRQMQSVGDRTFRTATALAELTSEAPPQLWSMIQHAADEVVAEVLATEDQSWRSGVEHGKWLSAQDSLANAHLEARLRDLQMKYAVLEIEHEKLKAALDRASLRDISNTIAI